MSVHDLRRLFVLCAILQGILADGSAQDHPIGRQPNNPTRTSCSTCPRDCPDLLSSPWYGKTVIDRASLQRNDRNEESNNKPYESGKPVELYENSPQLMYSRQQLSRRPMEYKPDKPTSTPAGPYKSTHDLKGSFEVPYLRDRDYHDTNKDNQLRRPQLHTPMKNYPEAEEKYQPSEAIDEHKNSHIFPILSDRNEQERRMESRGPIRRFHGNIDTRIEEDDKIVTVALTDEELFSLIEEGSAGGKKSESKEMTQDPRHRLALQLYRAPSVRPSVVKEDARVYIFDTDEAEADDRETSKLTPAHSANRHDELLRSLKPKPEEERFHAHEGRSSRPANSYEQWLSSRTSNKGDRKSSTYSDASNHESRKLYTYGSLVEDEELQSTSRKTPLLDDKKEYMESKGLLSRGSYDFPDDSTYFASRAVHRIVNNDKVSPPSRQDVCHRANPFNSEEFKEIEECFAPVTMDEYSSVEEKKNRNVPDKPVYKKRTNVRVWDEYFEAERPPQSIYEFLDTQESRTHANDNDSTLDQQLPYNSFTDSQLTMLIGNKDVNKQETNYTNKAIPVAEDNYFENENENRFYSSNPQRTFDNAYDGDIRYTNFPRIMVDIEKQTPQIPLYQENIRENRQMQFAEDEMTKDLDEDHKPKREFTPVNVENATQNEQDFRMNVPRLSEGLKNEATGKIGIFQGHEDFQVPNNEKIPIQRNAGLPDHYRDGEILSNFDPDLLDDFEEPMEPTEPTSNADFIETSTMI